jgi:ankyrin repeat protein
VVKKGDTKLLRTRLSGKVQNFPEDTCTALRWACQQKNVEMIKLLLDFVCDEKIFVDLPWFCDVQLGVIVVDLCVLGLENVFATFTNELKTFLSNLNLEVLQAACVHFCKHEKVDVLKFFLSCCSSQPLHLRGEPLNQACIRNDVEMVNCLLQNSWFDTDTFILKVSLETFFQHGSGENKIISSQNDQNKSLSLACEKGYVEIVKLFTTEEQRKKKCFPFDVSYSTSTEAPDSFEKACVHGQAEVVKLLLETDAFDSYYRILNAAYEFKDKPQLLQVLFCHPFVYRNQKNMTDIVYQPLFQQVHAEVEKRNKEIYKYLPTDLVLLTSEYDRICFDDVTWK